MLERKYYMNAFEFPKPAWKVYNFEGPVPYGRDFFSTTTILKKRALMKLAPIIIFTYNRSDHTRKTIEALRKNELAMLSDLFLFSDGF